MLMCSSQGSNAVTKWQKLQLFYQGILENGGKNIFFSSLPYRTLHSLAVFCAVTFLSYFTEQTKGQTIGCWSTPLCQLPVYSCAT